MLVQLNFVPSITWGVILGALSTIVLNVGKGVQSIGAKHLGSGIVKKWRESPEERKEMVMWIVGTLMTTLSVVLQVAAQMFLESLSVYAALNGVGVLAVALYSYYYLKEHITPGMWISLFVIISGTFLIFVDFPEGYVIPEPNLEFAWFLLIVSLASVVLFVASLKLRKIAVVGISIISGIAFGLGVIFQQFATNTASHELVGTLVNVYFVLNLAISQLCFWTTQYAYKIGGKASIVVPILNSLAIIVPFVPDVWIYGVPYSPFQYLSFFMNVAGIILLCYSSRTVLNEVLVVQERAAGETLVRADEVKSAGEDGRQFAVER